MTNAFHLQVEVQKLRVAGIPRVLQLNVFPFWEHLQHFHP
jgi:hypothetical protein